MFTPTNFTIGDIFLEGLKLFNYLGFKIFFMGNIQNLINERISKANQIANMILQATRLDYEIHTTPFIW